MFRNLTNHTRLFSFICAMLLTFGVSAQEKKTIVAYFSATGTTEAVPKQLMIELGTFNSPGDYYLFGENFLPSATRNGP